MKIYKLGILPLIVLAACVNINREGHPGLKISYYPNGKIKSIKHYYQDTLLTGEAVWFYPSGVIEQKAQFVDGIRDGPCYNFYPSGRLQWYRNYKLGLRIKSGIDYYDSPILIVKSLLFFNDSGHLYHKLNYNENGKFISEEGKKPN